MEKTKKQSILQLSIIITHHKTPHLLLMCLDSIKKHLEDINYEVFVCDSEASLGNAFLIKYYHPDAGHLAFRKNVGYARLVNEGLKEARGKFILILNADIVLPSKKPVQEMMEFLEKTPDAGIVAPKLLNIDGTVQQSFFREYTFSGVLARRTIWRKTRWGKRALARLEYRRALKNKPLEVDWVMGSCIMTKKQYIEKIGMLDERYFMYFEDVDWCRRFREAGFKIYYLPQIQVTHWHLKMSDSKKGLLDIFTNRLTRVHIRSYLKYLLKWKFGFQKPKR